MKKDFAITIDLGASNLRVALITKNNKILKYLKTYIPKIGNSKIFMIKLIRKQ